MNFKNTLLLTVLLFGQATFNQLKAQNSNDHVPGELIVQLTKGTDINDFLLSFDANYELKSSSLLSEPLCIWLLHFNENKIQENEILRVVNAHIKTKAVQFNHYVLPRVLEPNDYYYLNGSQWDMNNTGQNGGVADADIDAPEAWELCTGGITTAGDTVVVAVIDGGFDFSHPDLNFWVNYGEIPNNNIDDDGNGYIDDVKGWNASNGTGTIPVDQHGTHVSGTVAAKGNNGIGVAGINWNAKVMGIKGSSGVESIVVEAYSYVFKQRQLYNQTNGAQGAFVVATNSSFGVDYGQPANYPIWCAMYDSLGAVGILSAGATANANYNIDVTSDIPTGCPSNHLLSVTNSTRNDVKYSNAGYGATTIDLAAPGTLIFSTMQNEAYGNLTGTSMATPHVAGAVGLMISAACPHLLEDYKNYPDSIALLFKQFMLDQVDVIPSMQGQSVTGGRLNLFKALEAINNYCIITSNTKNEIANNLFSDFELQPNPAQEYLQLFYKMPQPDNLQINILDLSGRLVKNSVRSNFSAGYHAHIVDLQGLQAGLYFIQLQAGNTKSLVRKFIKE